MPEYTPVQLDELDFLLIGELEVNARQSVKDLAGKLGISRPTITVRIQRLLASHAIEIMPVVDPLAFGHKTRVSLGFNTLPGRADAVADALAAFRAIHHVAIFTGRYDVMAWAVLEDPEELPAFLMKDLTGIPGITRVETMVNLKILKISYSYVSDQNPGLRQAPPHPMLDELDLKLIGALREDALQTQKDLAPSLGTSPSTIRRRLQRLMDERIVRIVAATNPLALGYKTRATIGINVKPHGIDAVARDLARIRNVHHIVINTGHFALVVETDFKGPEDLSKFLREDLGNIPGLVSHETMVCLKTTKDNFTPNI